MSKTQEEMAGLPAKASRAQLEQRLAKAAALVQPDPLRPDIFASAAGRVVLADILRGSMTAGYERAHDALYGDGVWRDIGLVVEG